MRVIRRSLAPSISPYTNIPRGQRRSRFLQNMLHDLAFFQIPQNNAVYFFFNIPNLPIMTGQKICNYASDLQGNPDSISAYRDLSPVFLQSGQLWS